MLGKGKKESVEFDLGTHSSIKDVDNKNIIEVDEKEQNVTYSEANQMSEDLMKCIGEAIDKWSALYGMENMPKNMVFRKVLTIMNAWDKTKVFR